MAKRVIKLTADSIVKNSGNISPNGHISPRTKSSANIKVRLKKK